MERQLHPTQLARQAIPQQGGQAQLRAG